MSNFDPNVPQVLISFENVVCMHIATSSMIDIWLGPNGTCIVNRMQFTERAMADQIDHQMMSMVVEKLKEIGRTLITVNGIAYGTEPDRRKAYLRMNGFRRRPDAEGERHELDLTREYRMPTTSTMVVSHAPVPGHYPTGHEHPQEMETHE
jgi:hypothetical protein